MDERYSIFVDDDQVVIYGQLTIRESFDFLAFYDQQGYTTLSPGLENCSYENSAIRLTKETFEEKQKEIKKKNDEQSELYYENLYNEQKEKLVESNLQIIYLENLIKQLMKQENEKRIELKEKCENLQKEKKLLELKNNEKVNEIIQKNSTFSD